MATFSGALRCEFTHWDDLQTVAENPSFYPVTARSIAEFWSPRNLRMDLYVPVTYTVWGAVAAIAPRRPPTPEGITLSLAIFHLLNVLLHAGSAIAAFQVLCRLVRNDLAALSGAAIFAVHPVQVEAVTWVSGMKDVLSGMLSLMALWMYLEFSHRSQHIPSRTSRRWIVYTAGFVAFAGATLAKPQAVAIVGVAVVVDVLLMGRTFRLACVALLPWFLWCVPVAIMTRHAQPASLIHVSPFFRPVVALDALAFYFGKILCPIGIIVDYGRSPRWLIESTDRFWTWIFPVVVLIACIVAFPKGAGRWLRSDFRRGASAGTGIGGI